MTPEHISSNTILNALAGPSVIINSEGIIIASNQAWQALQQHPTRNNNYFTLHADLNHLSPEQVRICIKNTRDVLNGKKPSYQHTYTKQTPASITTHTMTVTPLNTPEPTALITHQDISNTISTQQQFERLLEAPIDAIMVIDENRRIAMVNAQMEQMFGYTRDELIGQPMDFLVPERYRTRHKHHHDTYYANPHPRPMGNGLDLQAKHKNGTEFPVQISLTPLETNGQTLISAAIRDLSSQKRTELQAARLGRILESSLNEIYLFNSNTLNFTLVNKGARDNLGYTQEELKHLTPLDIKPEYTKESFQKLLTPLRTGEQTNLQFNTIHKRKNGSTYPVEVHLQYYQNEHPPIFAAIIQDTTERDKTNQALRESETRIALHINQTPLAVIEWNTDDHIITAWNPAAQKIFGYTPEEVIHKKTADILNNTTQQDPPWQQPHYSGIQRNTTKSGRTITCEWHNTPITTPNGNTTRIAALALDVTTRQRALEALLTAQEEERARISRDLHDQVGQSLTAILLNINDLQTNPTPTKLERLKTLTSQTLEDVRHISRDLRPTLLDELGLEAALKRFAREHAEKTNLSIDVLARLPERYNKNTEIVIYRVVQESLTNIIRHANAQHASIILTTNKNNMHLIVEDDGKGFDITNLNTTQHVGLASMKERLELVGGSLRIESSVGRGTTISARLPIQ